MKHAKHTPGPWTVAHDEEFNRTCINDENTSEPVCEIYLNETHKQHLAIAHLISAAPEMLEALRWCVAALNYHGIDSTSGELDQAKAAIAKATGAQNV